MTEYDREIGAMRILVAELEKNRAEQASTIRTLVGENDELHRRIDELGAAFAQRTAGEQPAGGSGVGFNEMKEVQEQLRLTQTELDVLLLQHAQVDAERKELQARSLNAGQLELEALALQKPH